MGMGNWALKICPSLQKQTQEVLFIATYRPVSVELPLSLPLCLKLGPLLGSRHSKWTSHSQNNKPDKKSEASI
jgi:hypothetical protein